MSFGKHTQLTYVDGSTSVPISANNLNENERVLSLADSELAYSGDVNTDYLMDYFFNNNYKLVDDFQDSGDWTGVGTVNITDETANLFMGYQAVGIQETDNTGGTIGIYQSGLSLDLSEFNNGSSSDDDDFITFGFYVSNRAYFSDLTFKLGTNDTDNYSVSYTPNAWSGVYAYDGWHVFSLRKGDFDENGTVPGWDNITYVRVEATTTANAQNENVTVQHIGLVRVDPTNATRYNAFQKYNGSISEWENVFAGFSWDLDIVWDKKLKTLGILSIGQSNISTNQQALKVKEDVICFNMKIEHYAKWSGSGPSMVWYYNSDNYIECYIDGSDLHMRTVEAGSDFDTYIVLDNSLDYDEKYSMELIKDFDSIKAVVYKDGESVKEMEKETVIDSSYVGDLYLGWYSTYGFGLNSKLTISGNRNNTHFDWNSGHPKIVIKNNDETLEGVTTFQDDDELFAYLPPNGIFEVDLYLAVDGDEESEDIGVDWTLTGDISGAGNRFMLGPGELTTTIYNTEMFAQAGSVGHDNAKYGVNDSNWSNVQEHFIIQTGADGGKIQMQWKQLNYPGSPPSPGTHITTVKAGSYMKITKLKT
jgi:hypothetical protein